MRAECTTAWITGLSVLALLTGCASRGSVRYVESELARVSSQVEELRKVNDSTARELARTVAELKELHAGATTLTREEQARTQQLSRVEVRLADAEGTLRGLRDSVAELSREVGQLATRTSAPETRADGMGAAPRANPIRTGSSEQLYAAALAQMRAGEHGQAVLDFLDLIAKFPGHPLTAHAQYWIGEAYYLQRDFRQALLEFQRVIAQDGRGSRAADALLKIGLCYRALEEPLRAREAWEQLVQEFPRSEAARKARTLIRARPASATLSR